jgi:hypothetical protein
MTIDKDGRYTYTQGGKTAQNTQMLQDVGFEISEVDSDKKIGQILGTDKDPYNPAFPALSGVPSEGFIPSVIPELQNEPGGAQWSNAFQSLQAQFADPSVAMIDLPVVYNEDGSVVDFYIDQPTTQQAINPVTGKMETLTTTQRVLNPKYQALQDYAQNAQNQKNFQSGQKQQMDIQQLGMFPQILQMLTTPGVADILGLMGGGGVDPLLQPVFGQGFGLPSSVQGADMPMSDEAAESQLPAMAQPAMQQRQYLPTESYLQRIGPSAVQGLQGLMGFMGQTPYDLQRMVGSVTPQFGGILPGGGAPGRATGVR